VLLLLVAMAYQLFGINFRTQPNVNGIAYLAIVTAASCLYCWIFSMATERQTPKLRKWMDTHFKVKRV